MRGPEPVVNTIFLKALRLMVMSSGKSIAEQGYKDFLLTLVYYRVIDMALANNHVLRTAVIEYSKARNNTQISENNQLPTIGSKGGATRQVIPKVVIQTTLIRLIKLGIPQTYELDFGACCAA